MQPLAVGPRAGLSAATVTAIIRDSYAQQVSAGLELLDRDLTVRADLTNLLVAGSVSRSSYADLHGAASLEIEAALDWGSAIVRPYMVLSSTTGSARFNLGAYYTPSPKVVLGRAPVTYAVEAIDILDGLATPVGDTFAVAAGVGYLAAVETILLQQGYTQYVIDQASASALLPTARTWVLDENTTWLGIVNDLLSSIGYFGVWSDWDGRLRVQQYLSPSARSSEWTYDTGILTSMLAPERTLEQDMYRAPNRWVFWRSNGVDGAAPVEGAGMYTVVNQTDGATSIDARGGRVITKPKALDVADQPSLVRAGQQIVDADMTVNRKLTVGVAPNPLHWHFDVVGIDDPDVAAPGAAALVTKWTLPLDGGDGGQEWSLL
jgi:hypothetical protein